MKNLLISLLLVIFLSFLLSAKDNPGERENLGPAVNSQYDEIAPVISPDGRTLYFCRDGHPKNTGKKNKQDIWYSTLNSDGSWSEARNVGKPLNDDEENFVCSVSPDGNVLLLGNVYKKKGEGFSLSFRNGDRWSNPQKMPIKNFYNRSKFASAFLSNNEKILLMGIERDDSHGDVDLYVSFLGDDDIWTEPMNLGSTINTKSYDDAPFLAADGLTLFFASKGHGGKGGADIFMSRRLDKSWKKWTKPENIGAPFNTPGDDISFFIPADAEYGYFSSSEGSIGKQDIFRATMPSKFKPKPVILISGKVLNSKSKEPVHAEVYYEILPSGEEAGVARTNPETGEYKIALPSGNKYGYRAEAKGFISVNKNIDATKTNKYSEIQEDLQLVPIEEGSVALMNNLFFDFNKTKLNSVSYPELIRLVKLMNEYKRMKIEVAGHTDNVGSDDYNFKLSENRAKSVVEFISSKGIDKKRLSPKGYGKTRPVADNSTEEGRSQNRRVELIILEK